jgi:fructosamine-3-kinase
MIPNEVLISLKAFFLQETGKEMNIKGITSVSGGSINQAARLECEQGIFFIKWNHKDKYPKMFEREADGMKLLASKNIVRIPHVIFQDDLTENSFLLLEWIEKGNQREDYFREFGRQLSELHRSSFEKFGFSESNYIGTLKQRNNWEENWGEFFWGQRIEPMLQMARNSGIADRGDVQSFDNLYYKLDSLIPFEKPSLIHGDLWSGNLIIDENGNPCMIDPAVYFGNREMDIAMSQLFRGFDKDFYESYNQNFRLESDWEERVDLWNLYPLLVHVNLFGESYMHEVRRNVRRFL